MAIRSKEFVGIAEGIKSHELSLNGRIEKLRDTIRELSRTKRYLDRQVSYLEASLDAAYNKTDENGDFDYGRITSIEAQISEVERLQSEVESQLNTTNGELSYLEIELNSVLAEKAQTLYEIQERARKTSNNIAFAGGMYGAYAGVGSTLQASLNINLSSLSQAASILDGSVDAFLCGGTGGGQGHSAAGGSSASRDLSTSALSAFLSENTNQSYLNGSSQYLSPSHYSSNQNGSTTPATMSSFGRGSQLTNSSKTPNFTSKQTANSYVSAVFSKQSMNEKNNDQASKYQSSQESSTKGARFNPFSHWGQSKKAAKTNITEFDGLPVDKNSLHGDRYFVKGNNFEAYCEYSKNASQYSHVNCDEIKSIYAKDIEGIYLNTNEAHDGHLFWNRGIKYEMDSEEFFIKSASFIPELQSRINKGESIESITSDSNLRTCYELYFQKPVEVYEVNGFYEFAGSGRHRCMAAQKLGIDIPVRIVARYERKDNPVKLPNNGISSDTSSNKSKKNWNATIFESDISITGNNNAKQTIHMKRKVYQYNDEINFDYKRKDGRTNREAMLKGESPVVVVHTEDGDIECSLDLHHLTQQEVIHNPNSSFSHGTLVEIPALIHQKYNKTIHMQYRREKGVRRSFRVEKLPNHKYVRSSADRQFEAFKKEYWKNRVLEHDCNNGEG